MAVPKRKVSKSKIRSRVRSHKRPFVATSTCSQCGAPAQSHRVCAACGSYKGRQVLTVAIDE